MLRHALTAVATLLVGAGLSVPALASCDQLRFELANLHKDIDPQGQARKYARAIAEQKSSIRQLDFTMRQNGCSAGSMVVVDEAAATDCGQYDEKRARMERNLEILEHKRLAVLSETSTDTRRQELMQTLDAEGCNAEPVLLSTPGEDFGAEPLVRDDPGGFETIRVPSTDPEYGDSQFVDLGGAAMNGTFRTMCVRTCDGAYFPVSSHASTLDFRRDAQVCSMMCPGTETELYFHAIRQESAEMRSTVSGRPYDDMPNAYHFRTEQPADRGQCGCNFSLYYKEMMRREAYVKAPESLPERQSAITWIKPELRGGLNTDKQVAEAKPKQAERDYVPNGKIRIIGPRFLPDDNNLDFKTPTGAIEYNAE